jgi:2-desacetyl-2-hydroxyethyl bacteriochlorophyllide A dehydrogenase
MKTIVLEEPGRFSLAATDAPQFLSSDEALVRVHRVGICGTDIHAYRGDQPFFTYPRIIGHELGVEIVQVGANEAGLRSGDRCAVEPYLNCGHCIACRLGKTNCCVQLQVLGVHTDGGMREYVTVPIEKLYRSEVLSLEQLALVETLGIGAHAVERAQLEAGEFALVIGAGPIGLSVIQFAQLAGARVIVADVNDNRLNFCRQRMQVEQTIQAQSDILDSLSAITDGDLPTAVFDATGNAASMRKAFDYVANGGRVVMVGLVQGEISFRDPELHRRELTILGTRNSTRREFQRIIRLLEEGKIDTRPWITHRAPVEGMIEAFPGWLNPEMGVIKAMVEF